uniref:Uncharacterized protein n=1 Tax=Rhizophora mucronata TaxID=61149 RepID=A0A2P2IT68_RHIMU
MKMGEVLVFGIPFVIKEDVKLMVETGLEAYRFSISWSRPIPNGRGQINPKGLQYYNNLINELTRHGIQPHVTLLNFDQPQSLEDEYGGWLNKKIVYTTQLLLALIFLLCLGQAQKRGGGCQ